jgi:hypothetical protein
MVKAVLEQAQAVGVYFQPTRGGGVRAVGDAAAIDSIRELIVANKAAIQSHLAETAAEYRRQVDRVPSWVSDADWSMLLWLVDMFCRPDLSDAGELRTASGEWVSITAMVRELAAAFSRPDRSNRPLAFGRLAWFHRLYNCDTDAGGAIGWRAKP